MCFPERESLVCMKKRKRSCLISVRCEGLLDEIFTELEKTAGENGEPVRTAAKSRAERLREGEDFLLKSDSLVVRLNHAGQVVSLQAVRGGKEEAAESWEAAGEPMNTFRLYRNVNYYYDAWEIGSLYGQEA